LRRTVINYKWEHGTPDATNVFKHEFLFKTGMKKYIIIIVTLLLTITFYLVWQQKHKKEEVPAVSHSISPDSTNFYWFKNCVIYNLDVEVFKDSDGDGTGDFKGLIQKLPYLDSLGINVLWLAPFQPTPNGDDGYDITDYYAVDPHLGTIDDFKNFVAEAGKHNMRVIIDLVLNHTSDKHPWFQLARKDTNSEYHSWYSWSKKRPDNYDKGMAFPGVQKEIWTYDSLAREYYYHRFYNFEPDLNLQNDEVMAECLKVVKFWMDMGISGFREDAVPFFIEIPKTKGEKFEPQFSILSRLHNYLKTLRKDAIIMGEANVMPDENGNYFGKNKDGLQMMLNFYANQYMFYALATGEVKPFIDALNLTGKYPKEAQWGQFLRNHDEIDLGRLSKSDRNKVYEKFGPDKNMQLYERGIRRRLAPMFNNNQKFLQMAYSLLFALPSTPIIRYGEEIGMGDDLTLQERLSVRTPMQWSSEKNAGFSTAAKTVRPVIDTGAYGYKTVNVANEIGQQQSLLNSIKQFIRLRINCPEIGYGDWKILEINSSNVLAIQYTWQGKQLITVHNFSEQPQKITLSGKAISGNRLKSLTGEGEIINNKGEYNISLNGYGYSWYR